MSIHSIIVPAAKTRNVFRGRQGGRTLKPEPQPDGAVQTISRVAGRTTQADCGFDTRGSRFVFPDQHVSCGIELQTLGQTFGFLMVEIDECEIRTLSNL